MDDYEFPTSAKIFDAQIKATDEAPDDLFLDEDFGVMRQTTNSKIWIPSEPPGLRVAICIAAHCGCAGHRGKRSTMQHLAEYTWPTMLKDVSLFFRSCLQCEQTKGG